MNDLNISKLNHPLDSWVIAMHPAKIGWKHPEGKHTTYSLYCMIISIISIHVHKSQYNSSKYISTETSRYTVQSPAEKSGINTSWHCRPPAAPFFGVSWRPCTQTASVHSRNSWPCCHDCYSFHPRKSPKEMLVRRLGKFHLRKLPP